MDFKENDIIFFINMTLAQNFGSKFVFQAIYRKYQGNYGIQLFYNKYLFFENVIFMNNSFNCKENP